VLPHGERMMVAAVLDGHGGWQASEYAQTHLPATIIKELAHNSNNDDPQQLAAAMGRAFERVDRDFLARIKPAFEVRGCRRRMGPGPWGPTAAHMRTLA
jgi:serine/threonine protein phosphatase PrpC